MEQSILLIEPPFFRFIGANSNIFPLGLGYVGALLHEKGYAVHIYNTEQFSSYEKTTVVSYQDLMNCHEKFIKALEDENHFVWQEVREYIIKYQPSVIGMGVNTTKIKSALMIAKIAKSINSTIKIVVGGLHPTIMPDEVLSSEYIDFAVRGEGEYTFLEIIEALEYHKDINKINGISYKEDTKIFHTPQRDFLENLDLLIFPDVSLMIEEQKEKAVHNIIMCSRGCPYRCVYCNSANMWGRKTRFHSVKKVINEIKKIKAYGKTNHIQFFDDTFTYNYKWVTELCTALIAENVGIGWSCLTRVDKLDKELLLLMKKAGCKSIDLGVESGSQRVLNCIKKDITLEQIHKAEELMKMVGIPWNAFFIIGLPYETKEEMYTTLKLMKQLNCHSIILSIFTPYPGTEAYSFLEQQGLTSRDWEKYCHQSPENYFNKHVSQDEYHKIIEEAVKIVDRKNVCFKDLFKKMYTQRYYFLMNPTELGKKSLKLIKSLL